MSKQAYREAYSRYSREVLAATCDAFEVGSPEQVDATQRTQFLRVASRFAASFMGKP